MHVTCKKKKNGSGGGEKKKQSIVMSGSMVWKEWKGKIWIWKSLLECLLLSFFMFLILYLHIKIGSIFVSLS